MRTGEGDESRVVLMEDEEEEGQLDPSDSDTPNDGYPQQELSETLDGIARGLEEGAENNREDHGAEVRIVRQEIGLSGEEEYSLMGGEGKVSFYSFAFIQCTFCGEAACRVLLTTPCCL